MFIATNVGAPGPSHPVETLSLNGMLDYIRDHCLPLPGLGLIRVSGEDAVAFLQGQLSNDVRRLSETRGQITSYNSAKGRMLAVIHAFVRPNGGIYLEMPRALVAPVLKRLQMFVLRSRVTLEDASDRFTIHFLGGADQDKLPRIARELHLPRDAFGTVTFENVSFMRRWDDLPRFSVYRLRKPNEDAPRAGNSGDAYWRAADIFSGTPVVYPKTQDRFVPQMANLDRLGGIDFHKGCYTGQEVVARVHYLGAIKRRMFLLRSLKAPPPGATVHDGDLAGPVVGDVVDAVMMHDGEACVSAVLQLSHAESATLCTVAGPLKQALAYEYAPRNVTEGGG